MPINKSINKVMVIGSGPIIIGQAAEFDYAGAQACQALKEENLDVVLINSNPATIMTDKSMANHIYIEPLTLNSVKKIIEIEKPDSLLSTLGGQTGLTLSMELAKSGFLKQHNITLLGAQLETIEKAENRQLFKQTMEKINQPCVPSMNAKNEFDAEQFLKTFGLPAIIRPDFTLGGTGGGIAKTETEFFEIVRNGLYASPVHQILIEKSIYGWKEIEFEVIRDHYGNTVTVCSMENIDPVGIHTGDSIVVAPTLTLSDKEFQMLRSASIKIVNELKVEGGCNCQFALNPNSFEYAVIEVNPRVSRSSALASKATGYSIAKVATKIAIGFNLNEIENKITKTTSACFEPALDYVVIKFPRWPFDKFIYAKRELGPQMKSTGEVMSIASNFEHALMKAVQGTELGINTLNLKEFTKLNDEQLLTEIKKTNDKRIFAIYEAIKRNFKITDIQKITKIDLWFLQKIKNIANMENKLQNQIDKSNFLDQNTYEQAKNFGFLDSTIEKISGKKIKTKKSANFKMVDTCAAEFEASTPYFYSSFNSENEAELFIKKNKSNDKKKVLVLGSGPIRIGQGIEFDYCCVHCVRTLKEMGFEAIICNNNPETVSTDFDTATRLYFEPVNFESIMNIIKTEKPIGVIVQFGGQTAIKLTSMLEKAHIPILGTSQNSIDLAENRKRFDEILEKCEISRPKSLSAFTLDEAIKAANKLTYPVLMRPSYVLGGQNMIIAQSDDDIIEFMKIVVSTDKIKNPILIDKYISGIEVEVDAVCDGKDCLIPGIMEHIERAGIHSGDSISIYPAQNLSNQIQNKIITYTQKLAKNLQIKGLLNIQFVVQNKQVFVIEANPRSSRTVPYISKVTGVPLVSVATKICLGLSLNELGFKSGLINKTKFTAVKVPVFSFEKLHDVDVHLGPEMKSTGEVLGLATSFEQALFKGLIAAGYEIENKQTNKKNNGILITVKDSDKPEVVEVAKIFQVLGFKIYATKNTANFLNENSVKCCSVLKVHEGSNNTLSLIESKKVSFVISTSAKGRIPAFDSVKIRRKTVELAIPCLTSIDTAKAVANAIYSGQTIENLDMIDITKISIKNENST